MLSSQNALTVQKCQFNKTCIIGTKHPRPYRVHIAIFNRFCQQVFHLKYNPKVSQFYQIDYGFLPVNQKPKTNKTVTKGAGYVPRATSLIFQIIALNSYHQAHALFCLRSLFARLMTLMEVVPKGLLQNDRSKTGLSYATTRRCLGIPGCHKSVHLLDQRQKSVYQSNPKSAHQG